MLSRACFLNRITFASACAALVLLPAAADVAGPGHGTDAVTALTAQTAFAATDTLSNGNRVVYDGSQVWIETDAGVVVQFLGNPTPQGTFAGFIEVDPTETFAVLGETSNGQIFKVALAGGPPAPLSNLPFNYDLEYESATTALVSAATCVGFTCTNGVYRLDLSTGATTQIVQVDGYSGPVSLSGAGDLYLGVLPNGVPSGGSSVLRWTAAQVAAGPWPLTEAGAAVFTPGLDGVADMVFDPGFGHLFLTGGVAGGELLEIDRSGAVVGAAVLSNHWLTTVEIFDAPGDGACAAFQPAGRVLKYRSTDFSNGSSAVTTISPRRPVLTAVQNGNGTMTCTLTGGQPASATLVVSGHVSIYSPIETAYDLGTYLLWTGIPFNHIRRAGLGFMTDANGTGSFTFANPPSIQGTRVLHALVRDANGVFRGSSTPAFN